MRNPKTLWALLAAILIGSFAVLGFFGAEIYQKAPPLPERVVLDDGSVLFEGQDIRDGQNVWQSIGGQQVGSVWGHGAYVAPDWTADWLHREVTTLLDTWSQREHGARFDALTEAEQAVLLVRLRQELRTNTYDETTGTVRVSADRAAAVRAVGEHYEALFTDDPAMIDLRDAYALRENTLTDPQRIEQLKAFFFWTSWAASTHRPGEDITYTSNWPAEPRVGNEPTGSMVIWSVVSFVLLLAGIGALAWYHAAQRSAEDAAHVVPDRDPLLKHHPTPSQQATLKYFWVVAALVVVQVVLGAVTAHYGVEGSGFYGVPLDQWLPYAVTRTWHTQLGIFWIATAWLATGLYMAPSVSGYEPRHQRLGVDLLFWALIVIVVGSLAGEWLGVFQHLGLEANFWFGHQGYEYVDLGRFWQIFLLVGLMLWLGLLVRAMWPALRQPSDQKHLLGLFYAAGLGWGRQTNLAIAEYWRWIVVHLWVEGFFEVFATATIAFLFTRMGLVRSTTATASVLFATCIFLFGGVIGTFHHLYFSGTTLPILALGATFSALEVVPLVLVGFEATENYLLMKGMPWARAYRWPILFFVAVAFWNLVGAGLFGFFINPPIALYYMQGLNTTPVHAHTALFGVYGMLGIGLMLFCLRGLTAGQVWRTGALKFAFWSINVGLALMVLLSVLPIGLLQTWASVEHGLWYARSAEFTQTGLMETLRWLRIVGDTIFAVGILVLGWFVAGLKTGWSLRSEEEPFVTAEFGEEEAPAPRGK